MTASLAAVFCGWWIFWARVGWSICCVFTPLWLALAVTVIAFVNAVGLIVFVARQRTWGGWALAIVEAGNFAFSVAASFAVSPAWLITGATPALAVLVLVVVLIRVEAGTRPQGSA